MENENLFLNTFKLENSSRVRTYRLFCSFGLNSYLKCVKIEKFKFALCRFRVSAHRLAVEAGRWHTHTYKKYLFRVT